jgi:hypothetical protein
MIHALGVHNVFVRAQPMCLKWHHGMGVKQGKLLLPHVLKIVLDVSVVKVRAQQIS